MESLKFNLLKRVNWPNRIAELLVVFLGVSAGFILQNQKDHFNNNELKGKYILGLMNDVETNIEILEKNTYEDSIWLHRNTYAVYQILDNTLVYDSACALMLSMTNFSELSPQADTYEDIISSGNLNLFIDFELRKNVITYHKNLDDYRILDDYFKDFITTQFMPYMIREFSLFRVEFAIPQSYNSLEFQNSFGTYYSLVQQRLKAQKALLEESLSFKKLLDSKQ